MILPDQQRTEAGLFEMTVTAKRIRDAPCTHYGKGDAVR
jgi:hypothetical protein